MDETGWLLLHELQQNARLSYTELGQRVGLSSPAVAERVRRMEEVGIITGYRAEVDPAKLGLAVMSLIQIGQIGGHNCNNVVLEVMDIPEVQECYRVIGNDSIIVRVVTITVDQLAEVIDKLSMFGIPSTSIVRSNYTKRPTLPQEALYQSADESILEE